MNFFLNGMSQIILEATAIEAKTDRCCHVP